MEVLDIIKEINRNTEYDEIAFSSDMEVSYPDKQSFIQSPMTFSEPIVRIRERNAYTQLDIIFESENSNRLEKLNNKLSEYEKEITNNREAYIEHTLTLMPLFLDNVYVLFSNPMFWVTVPHGENNELKCISLLYDNRDIEFFEGDDQDNLEEEKEMEM